MPASNDFGSVVRRLWSVVRIASFVMIGVTVLVVGRETYALGRTCSDLHWSLGVLYAAAVAFALWKFVAAPLLRFWAMPAAVSPPAAEHELASATAQELLARARFLERIVDALAANPRLAARGAEIAAARSAAAMLALRAGDPATPIAAVRHDLREFEAGSLDALFAPLDEEANRTIRGEALAVGLGTAVSMNGVLDAWIVLWRNLNLVAKLAEIYYGRPGLRGTLCVLRDVATGVFVASQAQGVAEGAAGLFGGWLGKTGGALMGPVVDGALNAAVTVRVGYVAKRRCRSFRRWTEDSVAEAVKSGLLEAGAQAKGVALDVVKTAGGGLVHAAADVASAAGDAVRKATDFVLGVFARDSAPETATR
jgi:putative membrane protein